MSLQKSIFKSTGKQKRKPFNIVEFIYVKFWTPYYMCIPYVRQCILRMLHPLKLLQFRKFDSVLIATHSKLRTISYPNTAHYSRLDNELLPCIAQR